MNTHTHAKQIRHSLEVKLERKVKISFSIPEIF